MQRALAGSDWRGSRWQRRGPGRVDTSKLLLDFPPFPIPWPSWISRTGQLLRAIFKLRVTDGSTLVPWAESEMNEGFWQLECVVLLKKNQISLPDSNKAKKGFIR